MDSLNIFLECVSGLMPVGGHKDESDTNPAF